jgi:hypothetical protein
MAQMKPYTSGAPMMFRPLISCVLVLAPVLAVADAATLPACAGSLTADQKVIYDAVLLAYDPATHLESQVRTQTIALATDGQIPMNTAPDDAQIAAECLRQTLMSGED